MTKKFNTAKATEACNRLYALDTSRVPDTVDKQSEKVSVQCLYHPGFYDVSFRKLQDHKDQHSPGCSCCKSLFDEEMEYVSQGKRPSYLWWQNWVLGLILHREDPEYKPGRPHGYGEYAYDSKNRDFYKL